MKILYLSYDGMTDPLGVSQVINYMKRIADNEIHIDIISFEKNDAYKEGRNYIKDILNKNRIEWFPLMYTKNPPVVSTLVDMMKARRTIRKLCKKKKYDIVHSRGYITGIIGAWMKRKFGTKFIFDMRGWWADEKLESGNWDGVLFQRIYKYFKKKEIYLFKESDFTVSLTYAGKKEIVNNKWKESDKVGIIPTCVDFEIFKEFDENNRNEIRRELKIPDKAKVMVYSGSLGGNYDLGTFVNLFKSMRETIPDLFFLILSKTPIKSIKRAFIESGTNMDHIRVLSVTYLEVYKYLHTADVGLIFYDLAYSVIGRCPTKLGEYWASGLPIISSSGVGDLELILRKYPFGGSLIKGFEIKDTEAIKGLFQNSVDKRSLRAAAIDYFDISKGVKFYKELYLGLMNQAKKKYDKTQI